jgi:hypothetical protein
MVFANIFRKYKSLFETTKPLLQSIKNISEAQRILLVFKLLALLWISLPHQAAGQLNNEAFYLRYPLVAADSGKLKLHTYAMGFSRNNEYFQRFADGYTYFGYQAMSWLSYQPDARVQLWGGLFLRDDFGTNRIQELQPVFRIQARFDSLQLIFGTLQGSLNHQLIEPLYDFERVMVDRLEEGIQLLYEKERFWLDVWIDWERTIYPGSPFQERVSGGFSARTDLVEKEKLQLVMPLQMLAFHQGGQIDTDPAPLITRLNLAGGLELHRPVGKRFLHSWSLQPYVLGFFDTSHELRAPFSRGWGLYMNAAAYTRLGGFMLTYWQGDSYIPIKGAPLFSSASSTFVNPDAVSPQRRILMLRLLNEIPIGRYLALSLRLEPFYDFGEGRLDFANSIYLNYRAGFGLWNKNKPNRK